MAELTLQLMGEFAATLDGRPLDNFRTRLAQALLIYLAVQPERHRREQVMAIFWPDLPQASAQQNLRQNLYLLRQTIGEVTTADGRAVPAILSDRDHLQLNPEAAIRVDACRLNQILDLIQPSRTELEEAVALYRGEFLADFYLSYSSPFEEWSLARREAYRRGILDALQRLTDLALGQQDYSLAETYTRQQLVIDPLQEAANRKLIEILARSGRRVAAVNHYEAYSRMMEDELGLPPGQETVALIDQVRQGEVTGESGARRPVRGYELKEELGQSRHATVYRARQIAVDRDVALKVIAARFADDVEFIRRFEAEAQIIARLEHRHIVPLYDYWREPGGAYLVMRYLRGGDLRARLTAGALPADEVVELVDQIASALQEAHHNGIIHCDVKPGNILLDENGLAYLTDFGIAQLLQADQSPKSGDLFMGTPDYVSPEQVLSQPLTPLSDQYSLGMVVYELLAGKAPYETHSLADLLQKHLREPLPAIHPQRPDIPEAIDAVLARATAKDPRDRFPDVAAFARSLFAAYRATPVEPVMAAPLYPLRNPYKGLLPFSESDAAYFFGREAMVDQLLDRLEQTGPNKRFLALVGPSGSGKSSLVKAGLIPALRRGAIAGSENWFILETAVGGQPFDELEAALLRVAVHPAAGLKERLQQDPAALGDIVREMLPVAGDNELLLFIDHFEALFAQEGGEPTDYLFLDSLSTAIRDDRCPIRIIINLRADFYDRPLLHPGFSELLRNRTEVVVPLTVEELTRAIVRPAALAGVEVEPELVAALVAEVKEQPGALPLLQYTLSELFDRRDGDRLTLAEYQTLGGIHGALSQRAEAVYNSLGSTEQGVTRALFTRLAAISNNLEVTKRRATLAELTSLQVPDAIAPAATLVGSGGPETGQAAPRYVISEVIDKFGRARLLSLDRDRITRAPTVEIAHEALLAAWPRLGIWLDIDQAAIRLGRLLAGAAGEWQAAAQDESYLLRGGRLSQLAPLLDSKLPLTATERLFLNESLKASQAQVAAEEARRQKELATAQSLAEVEARRADEQARAANRLRGLVALLSAFVLLAGIAAALAFSFARTADRNAEMAATREVEALANAGLAATREAEALASARLATSRELSQAASNTLAVDPDLSMLLALEALDNADTKEANEALHAALQAARTTAAFSTGATGHFGALLALDPRGERLATAGNDAVTIRDALTGEAIQRLPLIRPGTEHYRLAFNAAGDGLALVSANDALDKMTLTTWDLANGGTSRYLEYPIALTDSTPVALSPDGQLLVPGRDDGAVDLWDVARQQIILRLTGHESPPVAVEFSPSGRWLATADRAGIIQIWDVAASLDRDEPVLAETIDARAGTVDTGNLVHIAFIGEDTLAVGYLGGIELWDATDPSRPPLRLQGPALLSRAFAGGIEQGLLGSAGQDGIGQLWSISDGRHRLSLAQHSAPVDAMQISPDGRRVYTLDRAGQLRVWDARLSTLGEQATLSVDPAVFDLELSPNGTQIALGNAGGPASTWDLATGERLHVFPGVAGAVYRVAYSPDGRRLATVGSDNLVHVWDAAGGTELMALSGHGSGLAANLFPGTMDVAFSPDGRRLASAGADGLAVIWDATTGAELMTLAGHTDSIHSLAWSPDGHYLATTSDDGDTSVIIWDATSGEMLHKLLGHVVRAWGVAFSPDSTMLVTGGARGIIKAWDVASGENLYTVVEEADHIGTVTFTPDGQHFITTGEMPLRVRRAADGAEVLTLSPPMIWSARVSPDGRWLYGGDVTGVVRVFALRGEDAKALALDRLTRWWTPDECRRYLHRDTCPEPPAELGS